MKIPFLKCKTHQKDTLMHCSQHEIGYVKNVYLSMLIILERQQKAQVNIFLYFEKIKKVLVKSKVKRIENLMFTSDLIHDEFQNFFKEINETIEYPMIELISGNFLEPNISLL
jgi:hypothetical protein